MSNSSLVFALSALKKANTANERIDNLPLPMVFKGTLGTGGTISTLPTASSENEGFVYIVITDGTYAGISAKAGDTFVSDGSAWVLVPSGDEPSPIDDTVTSTALTWSSDKINTMFGNIVKSFTYTGNNEIENMIALPNDCHVILGITSNTPITSGNYDSIKVEIPIVRRYSGVDVIRVCAYSTTSVSGSFIPTKVTFGNNSITLNSFTNAQSSLNLNNTIYTVTYI